MRNEEIQEEVLAEFARLAAIPRPSGHEERISNFLRDYLTECGFSVTQDKYFNIIADKAPAIGYEDAPLIILQGHMDMVCVAEDGMSFNPLTDAIKLKRDDNILSAVGTSLGADDGIGIAVAIYVLKHITNHGPLRLIVTVDEECGMSGAINLDPSYLQTAKYLINCDSEEYDLLITGSAGGVDIDYTLPLTFAASHHQTAWRITVGKLSGGHSGEDIGKGRANAIQLLATLLTDLNKAGTWELASFKGGRAKNVIPSTAEAIITTDLTVTQLADVICAAKQNFAALYCQTEPSLEICWEEAPLPTQSIDQKTATRIMHTINSLHSGVYTHLNDQVNTSANLGLADLKGNEFKMSVYARSFNAERLQEFGRQAQNFANLTGFSVQVGKPSPCWQEPADNQLIKTMSEIFSAQNGRPMQTATIHAGLECGWLLEKNTNLSAVSIGVSTQNIHSPQEALLINTIAPQVKLIMATLEKLTEKVQSSKVNHTSQMIDDLINRYPALHTTKAVISKALAVLRQTYRNGGKLLVCGNGGSAADAEHIVGELMKGFLLPRPVTQNIKDLLCETAPDEATYLAKNLQMALPAISLVNQVALNSAFANDQAPDLTYAQQVLGIGRSGDTLIAISTSGNSANVLYAVQTAKALGLHTIALTGKNGGKLKDLAEISIISPANETYLIQEHHLPIYHFLCAALENEFFAEI